MPDAVDAGAVPIEVTVQTAGSVLAGGLGFLQTTCRLHAQQRASCTRFGNRYRVGDTRRRGPVEAPLISCERKRRFGSGRPGERRTLCSSPLLIPGNSEPTHRTMPTMDLSRFPQEKCAEVRVMYLVEGDPAQY